MVSPLPNTHLTAARRQVLSLYILDALLAVIVLMVDIAIPLGVADSVPYIAVILITLWFPEKKYTLWWAIICTALTVVGFFYSPPGGEMWKVLSNRSLAIFAVWVTAILVYQRKLGDENRNRAIQEREKALEDVKVLSGLLPICASCKNIRDDKGYWNQIEVFIRDHSEADFSHGLCPECFRKLYPEYLVP
jgi:hypothetical protein